MDNKRIVIFTWNNISNAYSCLIYLKKLLEEKCEVELWSLTKKESLPLFEGEGFYSFYEKKYWKLRGVRHFLIEREVFKRMINNPDDIYIINDLKFFRVSYKAKKKNDNIKIIHYNTEIHGKDVKYPRYVISFYKRHADFPDMIIECLKERAEWRKKEFGINKEIHVINNSLPLDIIKNNNEECPVDIPSLANGRKVFLYAGSAKCSRNLTEILNCIPLFENQLFFLFYCYGDENDFEVLRKWEFNHNELNNFKIFNSIPRKQLLKIMENCDIGINYYDPKFSINHLYASPSKFYEYIACGMNVISTNNIGINKIIKDYDLGVCIEDGELISDALDRLIKKGLRDKEYIKNVFLSKYEYIVDSSECIKYLYNNFLN